MNVFFYSPKAAECKHRCLYYTCPQRCLSTLRAIPVLRDMVALYDNLHCVLPFNMSLRSGDLMILFAAGWHDLEELVAMQDFFESFRVILILGDREMINDSKCHQLGPRFVTTMETTMPELETVVNRMVSASTAGCSE
jgi:hypothetical protein